MEITVYEKNSSTSVASFEGTTNTQIQFSVQDADLWSPDSPTLYDVTVTLSGGDSITSYMGFRTISSGYVNGIMRPLLNGEFVFPFGTLDQGFWPDGIYTPPNREAMVFDLQTLKGLGFNMLRKHIKVENALFYQACDEMGVMLIQDMPSLRALQSYYLPNCTEVTYLPNEAEQAEFVRQLQLLVEQHKSYPSIFAWVIYNEGWGQLEEGYPEFALTDLVRSLDPTRLISSTSGWNDHGAGDFSDNHHYANPQCGTPFVSQPDLPIKPSPRDPPLTDFCASLVLHALQPPRPLPHRPTRRIRRRRPQHHARPPLESRRRIQRHQRDLRDRRDAPGLELSGAPPARRAARAGRVV